MVECYSCHYKIRYPRNENRQRCPSCGSEHWRRPTLRERLSAAWQAFKLGYMPKEIHKKKREDTLTDPRD